MFYSGCVPQGSRGVLYRMSQGIRTDDSDYEASVLSTVQSTDDELGSCIGLYRGAPQDSKAVVNRILQRWYTGFYMAGCCTGFNRSSGPQDSTGVVYRVLQSYCTG